MGSSLINLLATRPLDSYLFSQMAKSVPTDYLEKPEKSYRERFYSTDRRLGKEEASPRLYRLAYEAFIALDELNYRIASLERRIRKSYYKKKNKKKKELMLVGNKNGQR